MLKLAFIAAVGLLFGPALPVAAQTTSCSIADDDLATRALGTDVHGQRIETNIPGLDVCDLEDDHGTAITVSRANSAFGTSTPAGASALAALFLPDLPDAVQAQLAALTQSGIHVAVPGFELSSITGLGDLALWVKTDNGDSLLAQRGADAFAFESEDAPDAQARLTALARAILANP